MSAVESVLVSCDEPGCEQTMQVAGTSILEHDDRAAAARVWFVSPSHDLCPSHVVEHVARAAPPAAPTAGTTSTADASAPSLALDTADLARYLERALLGPNVQHDHTLTRQLQFALDDYLAGRRS